MYLAAQIGREISIRTHTPRNDGKTASVFAIVIKGGIELGTDLNTPMSDGAICWTEMTILR